MTMKVVLKDGVSVPQAVEMKEMINSVIKESQLHLGRIHFKKIYAVVEHSPSEQPFFSAGGKFLGVAERLGMRRDFIRPSWVTRGSNPRFVAFDIRDKHSLVEVARFARKEGWSLDEN